MVGILLGQEAGIQNEIRSSANLPLRRGRCCDRRVGPHRNHATVLPAAATLQDRTTASCQASGAWQFLCRPKFSGVALGLLLCSTLPQDAPEPFAKSCSCQDRGCKRKAGTGALPTRLQGFRALGLGGFGSCVIAAARVATPWPGRGRARKAKCGQAAQGTARLKSPTLHLHRVASRTFPSAIADSVTAMGAGVAAS